MREWLNSQKEKWHNSGIENGDTMLVHSDISRTLREARRAGYPAKPQDVLQSFLEAVGPEGTLLLPLFNFDFASTACFDIRGTPSQMGALTEIARLSPDAIRTGHPIYSFAAIGNKAHFFNNIDNKSGYGEDSPFGVLRRIGGKIASLDLPDQNSMTFYHHVEEMKRVDYRFFKNFSGEYTNWDGQSTMKTYQLFVRDLKAGIETNVNPAGELLWHEGLYIGDKPGHQTGLRTILADDMFQRVSQIIDENKANGLLYSVHEEANDR
jgi:aminoglycoside 3-N-acetyltransferase